MVLGNTPRRETNFYVEASKSYAFGLRFLDVARNPLDLTGCVVRLVVTDPPHQGATEVINRNADSPDLTTGFVQFNLQAEDLALEPNEYRYDITLVTSNDYSNPILKGYFEVGSNTDEDISNKYLGVQVGSELSVVLENGDVLEIVVERVDGLYTIVSELMKDFSDEMAAEVTEAAGYATDAQDSANMSQQYAEEMRAWLDNAGYPFWKGTQAEYDALTVKREVLYLITDEVPGG